MMQEAWKALRKFLLFLGSVFLAYILLTTSIVENLLIATKQFELIGIFVAGAMFTSILTVAPATIILGEIAQANTLWVVAVVGGIGAGLMDAILLFIFKEKMALHSIGVREGKMRYIQAFFGTPGMRWFGYAIGAFLIATPLPDELGLALMGLSNVRARNLFPIAALLNGIGIYFVGLAAIALLPA